MHRRKFLIGATGLSTLTAGCSTLFSTEDQMSTDWETRANRRIQTYRTSELEIAVTDSTGTPVPDATVDVAMQSHQFGFGTAVDAKRLLQGDSDDPYRTYIPELFNKAVLENRHKWGFWEQPTDRQYAIDATNWLLNHGLEMRGHTCIWQKLNQGAIPADVVDAMRANNGQYVSKRARDHIKTILGHYRDRTGLTEWDVVNEPTTYHSLTETINPESSATTPPELLNWYTHAQQADSNAQLYINEFNILLGRDETQRDTYEQIIEYLLANEAPLHGIGLQAHYSSLAKRRSPSELLATFDRFGSFGIPLQVTEYDNWGPNWTDEKEANHFYKFLKTTFSHPAVEGFLVWGFWNGAHWKGNAPFFREDWSHKPAYDRYRELVFDEWWTDERGVSGTNGQYQTTAFLGEYQISVSKDGTNKTVSTTVSDPETPTTIEVTLPL